MTVPPETPPLLTMKREDFDAFAYSVGTDEGRRAVGMTLASSFAIRCAVNLVQEVRAQASALAALTQERDRLRAENETLKAAGSGSCHCPAAQGEDCPFTAEECTARSLTVDTLTARADSAEAALAQMRQWLTAEIGISHAHLTSTPLTAALAELNRLAPPTLPASTPLEDA